VHSWGTGSHYNPIETQILDIILNEILTGIRTHILIISGDRNMGESLCEGRHSIDIYSSGNVNPTMTDVNAYLHDSKSKAHRTERIANGINAKPELNSELLYGTPAGQAGFQTVPY